MALDELRWLARQDVLGAGSVVMYGKVCPAAKVVMRPEVILKVDASGRSSVLTYVTAEGKLLKPEAIGATLVRTHWPLRRVHVSTGFEWDGLSAEWDPPMPELREFAESVGIQVAATDSSEKLRGLVRAKAIGDFTKHHVEAVSTVWKAKVAELLAAEQNDQATKDSQLPALPATEQDNETVEDALVPPQPAAAWMAPVAAMMPAEQNDNAMENAQVPALPAA